MAAVGSGLPPEIEEQFLRHVLACELEEEGGPPLLEQLRSVGVEVAPPDELDDERLPAKLREVIDGLATLRVYLSSTDHLSDRDLYRYLWKDVLPQPTLIDDDPRSAWHYGVVGGGSDEDIAIYLRYYADSEERARWATDFPDMDIPTQERRPFDRDRHLPRPRGAQGGGG